MEEAIFLVLNMMVDCIQLALTPYAFNSVQYYHL